MKKISTTSNNTNETFNANRELVKISPSDFSIKVILDFSKAYSSLPLELHKFKGIILN